MWKVLLKDVMGCGCARGCCCSRRGNLQNWLVLTAFVMVRKNLSESSVYPKALGLPRAVLCSRSLKKLLPYILQKHLNQRKALVGICMVSLLFPDDEQLLSGWFKPILSASCSREWDHLVLAKSSLSLAGADFTDEFTGADSEATAKGIRI